MSVRGNTAVVVYFTSAGEVIDGKQKKTTPLYEIAFARSFFEVSRPGVFSHTEQELKGASSCNKERSPVVQRVSNAETKPFMTGRMPENCFCISPCGMYRRKYHLRAAFQAAAFLVLIMGTILYNAVTDPSEQDILNRQTLFSGSLRRPTHDNQSQRHFTEVASSETDSDYYTYNSSPMVPLHFQNDRTLVKMEKVAVEQHTMPGSHRQNRRSLSKPHLCSDLNKASPDWIIAFLSLGVLYMFLALAIVCDEFFVPALEEMASSRRMNLSMDVAGATLMAAGGSAPELFSSLFGTFQESEIGFGTIIGSAVFNVLFVIAMCSIFAKEVLTLTWWPLFRDCVCYTVGLVVLAVFVGINTKEKVELYESCILFGLYICYILIMWKNADMYKYLTGKELEYPEDDDDGDDGGDGKRSGSAVDRPESHRNPSSATGSMHLSNIVINHMPSSYFCWQGTFRAGILKLLRHPNSWVETGGVGIVAKLAGDADAVFREIDENGDGHIDRDELKRLFTALDCSMTDVELEEVFNSLDEDKDGVIDEEEFHKWYTSSAELIRSQIKHIFDELDTNNSNTIDKNELMALLVELDPRVTDEDCQEAIEKMYQHGDREEITFEEFKDWYEHSIMYERHKKAVEEDMEGAWENLHPPFGEGILTWIQYIIVTPLVFVMAVTIPDVRIPGRGKWCYVAFILSIVWIGGFAYLMVTWADMIGNTLGVPSVVMGLTVLAAGTSVPDLLSSVIVARRGSGDMAVSSSIGSNIFDILVGLPIPWMLYSAVKGGKPVEIGSDNIFQSLFILVGMLVFVIGAVHCQGWRLTKTLGGMMIIFYFGFLAQAIYFELPFKTCVKSLPP